jgi:ribose 5-phosphate isomerase B
MKIYFAADHAGFDLKNSLISFAHDKGYKVEDCGAFEKDDSDDYPNIIACAAQKISENPRDRAVILGGSGQGEAMVANRFPNVRAAVYYGGSEDIIRLSREHNDANVLSLGARMIKEEEAKEVVLDWLRREFNGEERHVRRIIQIENILNNGYGK